MRSKYKRRFQCFLRNLYRNHVALIFCFSIFVHALWCLFSYKDFQNSSASSKGCHDFTCYLHTGFNASCIEFNDSFLLLSIETKLSTLELSAALGTSKGFVQIISKPFQPPRIRELLGGSTNRPNKKKATKKLR